MNCPERGKYKLIDGVCYFFDNTGRNFDEAQTNCKKIFGPTGKVYEPKTEAEGRIWYDNYGDEKLLNARAWVGITDRETESVYKYASSGIVVPESALSWYSGYPNDNSGNEDCVINGFVKIKNSLRDYKCSEMCHSICEW